MHIRHIAAGLFAASAILAGTAVQAQTPADFTQFSASCLNAAPMLLGQVPPEIDVKPILTPLCSCLATELKDLPQADIDVLETDLAGTATEESHAAHGTYDTVAQTAGTALGTCFQSPEVSAAIQAIAPQETPPPAAPPADAPAAPPADAPPADAPAPPADAPASPPAAQ